MKFRVTCFIDDKLLGPVTELMAPYGKLVIVPHVAAEEGDPPRAVAPRLTPLRRRLQAPRTGASDRAIFECLVKGPATRRAVHEAFERAGLVGNGASAMLSKFKRRGLARQISSGVWELTPRGLASRKMKASGVTPPPMTGEVENVDA